ncbi:MAG: bifunctional transcriptional activator/DNA repair protein Ada [Anaerolineaceae bacterium]|nr:bifunctional transcriptional activator/DNA repair protein Ada [Anaerolineaceae bacterium]
MNRLPPHTVMIKAMLESDASFEGIFITAVKTTGIFCRPTCTARKPKPENVQFFSMIEEALFAGFRPCKRCHPMDRVPNRSALVETLTNLLDEAPTKRITSQDLRNMNIDPSTALRQFKRTYGMTFQQYQRGRRMGSALHDLQAGDAVIAAQVNHGFNSSSGFWEAFKQLFGTPPSQADQAHVLFARWIDTPLGGMLALADDAGLHLLEFVDRRALETEIKRLRAHLKCSIVPGNHMCLDQIENELKAYFEGTSLEFSVPLVALGSDFEKSVWKLLKTIPPGETWSYLDLAKKMENPNATRAVGHANGKNSIAIIIPCHRVIRTDGTLGGYGGGIWRKQWLLEHERTNLNKTHQPKLI